MRGLLKRLVLLGGCFLFQVSSFAAQEGVFRWAADLQSGVPSVFYALSDPGKVIGFEKELADSLAYEMGRDSVFNNSEWDGQIPGLLRGSFDAIINTVVVTPERAEMVDFSEPYCVTYEQLVVRAEDDSIRSLEDCKGRLVGTLKASRAAQVLEEAGGINIRYYNTEINFFTDLSNGRLDAALIDAPIAMYYAAMDSKLKLVGDPIDRIEYAVVVRKGDQEFLSEINGALDRLIEKGVLRNILERWNLWSEVMADYTGDFSDSTQEPEAYNAFLNDWGRTLTWKNTVGRYISFLPKLGKGALMTMEISILAMILAIVLGFLLAIARVYGPRPLSILSKLYIEIFRGTPLLIQLYFIFYGLPAVGIKFDPFVAGVIAIGLNYGAFEAENYRAGILSVHKGQMEAARALGMTHWQGLRYVVIPQAFRVMLPPVTNDFISLLKDSSLVSVITIIDLTFAYNLLATTYFNYFGIGILVAVIYLLLGLPFVMLARWAEKRLSRDKRKARI